MKRCFIFMLMIIFMDVTSYAAIHRVSKDGTGGFTTIQAAVSACVDGDTVVVRGDQGNYVENIAITHRIALLGQGVGCEYVAASAISGTVDFQTGSSNSVMAGFNVSGSLPVWGNLVNINASGVVLRRCIVAVANSSGDYGSALTVQSAASATVEECWLACSDPVSHPHQYVCHTGSESESILTIRNSIVSQHGTGSTLSVVGISSFNSASTIMLQNCVFLGLPTPLQSSSVWSVDHCIFWNTSWNGSMSGAVTSSYNAITANMTSFPGSNNIAIAANPFVSYNAPVQCEDDLHLTAESGLIDAGDSNAPNDRDGTQRDLGIYGGPLPYVYSGAPDFPFVTNFFVSPYAPQNGVLEIRTTGRVGRGN